MSVIIRLQNLPWSASALDIRQYFHGLAIPEGGVHIVGGEQGDAFIAFSTDEDARQAMLMDGGKIKDAVVRLHLSSRSQMQKVIEDARQAALQPFMQIPASVPQTLAPVQNTTSLIGQMTQMNHMGGHMTSQLTSQMALTTGQITNHMLQVLPQTNALAHTLMSTGSVAAPGSRGLPVNTPSLRTASIGDAGATSAAAPLDAARFQYGMGIMGGAMMGVAAGAAALPIAGAAPGVRQPARESPAVEEDADDRKDDDIGRRRDRRERSRSRERRDRDRYRDRDRSSYDRRRRSRERSRERDRGRRRRSRSSSRSRDRNPRRSSRDKRDHDRSIDGPDAEGTAVSGTGLLKTPDRSVDGSWNQQPCLRDAPSGGLLGLGGLIGAVNASVRLGVPSAGGSLGVPAAPSAMAGSSIRGPLSSQGTLPMRNGPSGYGGMGPGGIDSVRRADGPWMQRDGLPPDVDRRQDNPGGLRGFDGPGPMGSGGRMGPMFDRPGLGSDLGRSGMGIPGPAFMDRGGMSRPRMSMPDRPGMMDRFRPNGFDRNAPLGRPVGAVMDRLRPTPVGPPGPNIMKDRFPEMDNNDEDYEEQDMDMEDPFPDSEETGEERQPNPPFSENSRNPPYSGSRPDAARDDRYPYRDDHYDRRRSDRDRDRDRGHDRDRRDRDRYRSSDRDRDRREDGRYDRHGKDEFGRDRPDERYSRDRFKDRPPEPNTCIEIRNMALSTGYGDIRRFFQPLVIPGPGLKIINDEKGRRTGVAYIRFSSRRDRESALTYSKSTLRGESILISDLSDEIFENAIDSYLPERDGVFEDKQPEKLVPKGEEERPRESNSQVESSSQYTCVVVHNAPNYAKDDDIRRLFKYCSLDVFWEVSKEGRRQKVAYVKFKKTEDCKRFLFANSKFLIGNNEIKVVGCSEKEYDDAKLKVCGTLTKGGSSENKSAEKPTELNSGEMPAESEPKQKQNDGVAKVDDSPEVICVPDDDKIEEQDNHDNGIHNNSSKSQGESYVPMPSPQRPLKPINTECVVLRNLPPNAIDRDILDFFSDVGLVPLKIHIMVDYMRNPIGEAFCEFLDGHEAARAATKHNSHMGKYVVNVVPVSRMEMNNALSISNDAVTGGPHAMMGGPGPGGLPMGQSRPPFHGPTGGHFSHGPGGHPGFMGLRGPGPAMRGAPNSHGLLGVGPAMGLPGHRGPGPLQLQDMSAEGFGRPGCVIACENIPFRAEIDDILEYFGDFNLTHDSVIRRYNERGLPTGDARIAFNTPVEAQSAIRDLRFKKLQGRSIYMRVM